MLRQLRNGSKKIGRSPIAHNAAALYGVQICRKVFPLVSVPYLARTLHAEGWGTVAFVLSLGEIGALLIEFGFNLSATREMSQNRHSKEACASIMSGVLGAQAVLSVISILFAMIVSLHVVILRSHPEMIAAGILYSLAQGCTPLWFFQGLERLRLAAGLEIAAKSAALAGIFVFVHRPEDGFKVIALQALAAAVSTSIGIALAIREFSWRYPRPTEVIEALRKGWPMFVFRSAESLYGVGNSFVLGLFAGPEAVGYFAVAEKISKAIFGLLNPIREALYPRLSYLAASAREQAAKLARTGIALMTAAGAFLSCILFLSAPQLIRLLAGPGFGRAVPVLRILAALPLILSVTYSVGLQWLLPLGRDGIVNRIILCGGVLNITLAFLLAPHFAEVGMAGSVLSAELLVCFSMVWTVCRTTDLWARSEARQSCEVAASAISD
ncbi:MAG: flippase [Bryobacteraceae bacterium]